MLLFENSGYPLHQVRLFFGENELKYERNSKPPTLSDYGVENGSTLTTVSILYYKYKK